MNSLAKRGSCIKIAKKLCTKLILENDTIESHMIAISSWLAIKNSRIESREAESDLDFDVVKRYSHIAISILKLRLWFVDDKIDPTFEINSLSKCNVNLTMNY